MKSKLLLVLLLVLSVTSFAQNSGPGYAQLNDFSMPFMRSVFWLRSAIPAGSIPILTMSGTNSFRIHTDSVFMNTLATRNDTTVYKLVQIGSDAMLRAFIPSYLVYNDTIQLSNRINLKLNISDTSGKWLSLGYVPNWNSITNKPNFLDSTTLYTLIGGKLNISDTFGKWIPISKYVSDSITIQAKLDLKMDKADSVLFYPRFSNPAVYIKSSDTGGKWLPLSTHIPVDPVNSNWNSVAGLSQILNKPTIPTVPTNVSAFTNDAGYLITVTSGQVTGALGFTPYNSTNPSNYISSITSSNVTTALGYTPVANARTITINGTTQDLTTNRSWSVGDLLSSGTYPNPTWLTSLAWSKISGAPTTLAGYGITDGITTSALSTVLSSYATSSALTSGLAGKESTITAGTTLQYWRGDKSWQTLNTTVVPEGANQYHTDARSRASISLTTTGTSGSATYNSTTGVLNVPAYTTPSSPTFNNAPARSLNTSFQVSTTNNSRVSYSVACATGVALLNLNSAAQVFLEISSNNSTWLTIAGGGSTQTLAVALSVGINTSTTQNLQCEVPAGYWVRLRTVTSGGGTTTFASGQEVTY